MINQEKGNDNDGWQMYFVRMTKAASLIKDDNRGGSLIELLIFLAIILIAVVLFLCKVFDTCPFRYNRLIDVVIEDVDDDYRLRSAGEKELNHLKILRHSAPVEIRKGMKIKVGDEITTDHLAYGFFRFTRGLVEVISNTTCILVKEPSRRFVFGKREPGIIMVRKGMVFSRNARFDLQTKYITAAHEGTEFYLEVLDDDIVEIVVLEGTVRISPNDTTLWNTIRLKSPEKAVIRKQEEPERYKKTLRRLTPAEVARIYKWLHQVEREMFPGDLAFKVRTSISVAEDQVKKIRQAELGFKIANNRFTGDLKALGIDSLSRGIRVQFLQVEQHYFLAKLTHEDVPRKIWLIEP